MSLYKGAPNPRTRRSRIAGFSMVELAVSLTVLLILTAIAIPSLMRSFRTYQLNDAAARLSDMLKFTRFEARTVQLDLVTGVVRVSFGGFLVVDECGVVVLNRLRFLTLVVIGLALRTACCEQSETNTQE